MNWWKNLFAYYNPNTREIEHCEKYSVSWYHEKRHDWQFGNKWVYFLWGNMQLVLMCLTVILQRWEFMIPIFILTIILELDAWQWSLREYNKKQLLPDGMSSVDSMESEK